VFKPSCRFLQPIKTLYFPGFISPKPIKMDNSNGLPQSKPIKVDNSFRWFHKKKAQPVSIPFAYKRRIKISLIIAEA